MQSIFESLKNNSFGRGITDAFTEIAGNIKQQSADEEKARLRKYLDEQVKPMFSKNTFTEEDYKQGLNVLGNIATSYSPEISTPVVKQFDTMLDNYAQYYKIGKYSDDQKDKERKAVSYTFGTLQANDQINYKDVLVKDKDGNEKILKADTIRNYYGQRDYYDQLVNKVPAWKKDQKISIGNEDFTVVNDSEWFSVGSKNAAKLALLKSSELEKLKNKKDFADYMQNYKVKLVELQSTLNLDEKEFGAIVGVLEDKAKNRTKDYSSAIKTTTEAVKDFLDTYGSDLKDYFTIDNADGRTAELVNVIEKDAAGIDLNDKEAALLLRVTTKYPTATLLKKQIENLYKISHTSIEDDITNDVKALRKPKADPPKPNPNPGEAPKAGKKKSIAGQLAEKAAAKARGN